MQREAKPPRARFCSQRDVGRAWDVSDEAIRGYGDALTTANVVMSESVGVTCRRLLYVLVPASALLVLGFLGFSLFYAYVYATGLSRDVHQDDWISCFVRLGEDFEVKSVESFDNSFVYIASKQAVLCIFFGIVPVVTLLQAIGPRQQFDALPNAIFAALVSFLMATLPLALSTIIPMADTLNASLPSLREYVKSDMYAALEESTDGSAAGSCDAAYETNEFFISAAVASSALTCAIVAVEVYLELRRRETVYLILEARRRKELPDLPAFRGGRALDCLSGGCFLALLIAQGVKAHVQVRMMDGLQQVSLGPSGGEGDANADEYPFPQYEADNPETLLTFFFFASAFATSHRDAFAARVAGFFAFTFVLTYASAWSGAMRVLDIFKLDSRDSCLAFFQVPTFGNPSDNLALEYCYETWVIVAISSAIFAAALVAAPLALWMGAANARPPPAPPGLRQSLLDHAAYDERVRGTKEHVRDVLDEGKAPGPATYSVLPGATTPPGTPSPAKGTRSGLLPGVGALFFTPAPEPKDDTSAWI